MSEVSQFQLLGTRRLLPLFVAQFFGAFNDNLYKFALIVIFTYGGMVADDQIDLLNNLAAGLFILPFFLFSGIAGTLADRIEKSSLIRKIKLAEIVIACLIGVALFLRDAYVMLFVLFLLGVQSTFFGPLKYGILPQHLKESELVGGNAIIEMGTFVAILLGTLIGGIVGGWGGGVNVGLSIMLVAFAITGFAFCLAIPKAEPTVVDPPVWNPVVSTIQLFKLAFERKAIFQSILGVSWFWVLGSVYLTQLAQLTKLHLAGNPSVNTFLLTLFTIFIAAGSLVCERLSGRRIEIGLVPVGAFGISAFGIDAYFAIQAIEAVGERTLLEFLGGDGSIRVLIDLALVAFFCGMYSVPLMAQIQARTPTDRRARVIAAVNVWNSMLIVAGAGFSILWLSFFDIPTLFLLLALMNAVVAFYIFQQVPEFTIRFVVWLLSHSIYKVSHEGLENIPDRGAAMIVCNHVSFVDALLLGGAIRRPVRFIMSKDIYEKPILNYLFRKSSTIPIQVKEIDPEAYDFAFNAIREGLENRDLLCIFPEGKLTRDGEIDEFRPGILKILEECPVPVYPAALQGLWGSYFTYQGAGMFKGSFKLRSKIGVVIGEPVEPEALNVEGLRSKVANLRRDLP